MRGPKRFGAFNAPAQRGSIPEIIEQFFPESHTGAAFSSSETKVDGVWLMRPADLLSHFPTKIPLAKKRMLCIH